MFGKTKGTSPAYEDKCGISAYPCACDAAPVPSTETTKQQKRDRAYENRRIQTLHDLLIRIDDEVDAQQVAFLADAYKSVRGY